MVRFVVITVLMLHSIVVSASETPADSRNVVTVKRFFAAFNRGDAKAAAAEVSEDTKNFGRAVGQNGMEARVADIVETFPDWHMEILEVADAGDIVIARCKVSGTHRGVGKMQLNGMPVGAKPTGKHFEVTHMHWFKLENGAIVEHYANRDDLGMLRQLGLLPVEEKK